MATEVKYEELSNAELVRIAFKATETAEKAHETDGMVLVSEKLFKALIRALSGSARCPKDADGTPIFPGERIGWINDPRGNLVVGVTGLESGCLVLNPQGGQCFEYLSLGDLTLYYHKTLCDSPA